MMEWSLQGAKIELDYLVNSALTGCPQFITSPGQRAVVIISAAEYDRLRQLEESHPPSFNRLLLEIPQDDQEIDRPSITPRDLD